jgi:hypothetical protein
MISAPELKKLIGLDLSLKPNFTRGRAKRLILFDPAAECSHKLFHISLDAAELQ